MVWSLIACSTLVIKLNNFICQETVLSETIPSLRKFRIA